MTGITRRQFLLGAGACAACGAGSVVGLSGSSWWEGHAQLAAPATPVPAFGPWTVEASHYVSFANDGSLNCAGCHSNVDEPLPVAYCHIPHLGSYVRCNLCPHRCIIQDGERGLCRVRENRSGKLYSVVFGNPCAVHVDPIEKTPFFHFLPAGAA